MSRISRYISWVDQDIAKYNGNVRGLSSMVALIPITLMGLTDYIFKPVGDQRTLLFILGCAGAAFFSGIWIWRIVAGLFGNQHG